MEYYNSNSNRNNRNNTHHSNHSHHDNHGAEGPTKLKVKGFRQGRLGENRILLGIIILALIVVAGFLLTWAFPRNIAKRPEVSPPPNEGASDAQQIIIQRVTQVPGVRDAQVIVLSRVALIVIEVDPELPASEVKRIKNESASQAEDISGVEEVLVTASPDLAKELKKILSGDAPLERLEYIYERIRDQNL